MRWISFAVLACVFLILQTSLAGWVEVLGVRPDWVLILVLYYALHARGSDAMLAGWILGMLVDLCGSERMGLFALTYGLCAASVVRVRGLLFRDHPLSDFLVTCVFALIAQLLHVVYRLGYVPGTSAPAAIGEAVLTALYTAAWAPYVQWCLRRADRLLGTRANARSSPARA